MNEIANDNYLGTIVGRNVMLHLNLNFFADHTSNQIMPAIKSNTIHSSDSSFSLVVILSREGS